MGGDWGVCVVTNASGIVQGLLGREALRSREPVAVEEAMTLGPSTIRPSARRDAVLQRMRDQGLSRIVVTHPDGAFAGVVRREDLE
ncbi:MAG TPA: CBS domain-containing protein [Gaiellaceae bacterium]|nr:CBS domain-containing protein [Gaiellaceae bacterium]